MKHMNKVKILFCIWGLSLLQSCGDGMVESQDSQKAIRELAEKHVRELKAPQLLEEFLLSVNNDTAAVCYTIGLPRPVFERLMNEETYPTPGGLDKMRHHLVLRYVLGTHYTDSCKEETDNGRDRLMDNSANEPIDGIWENIVYEDF